MDNENTIPKIDFLKKNFRNWNTRFSWKSNTRFLLKLRDWKGYIFEGSGADIKKIKSQKYIGNIKLKLFKLL